MGLFKRGVHETSLSLDDIKSLSESDFKRLQKTGRIPTTFTSAKELKASAKQNKKLTERALNGEKGAAAIIAGMRGGGTRDARYQSIPLKERVHPARYQQILHEEAKRQGLL